VPLTGEQIVAEAFVHQQSGAQPRLHQQGEQEVRHLDAAIPPEESAPVGLLQQLLKGVTDVERGVRARGLVGAESLQAIQEPVLIHGQSLHPGGEPAVEEQRQQQVLHIHGAVAPAAGLLLTGDQQVPCWIAEALWTGGEAGGWAGRAVNGHGWGSA
jgi:hypothetical protein